MQVNLDDSSNINVEKTGADEFVLTIDTRTKITFSRSELKFVQAMIDSALKEADGKSVDSLKDALKNAMEKQRSQLQLMLRNFSTEDIAYVVWFVREKQFAGNILANISKRAADDVQAYVLESIDRRIRKEKAEGNVEIEEIMKENGRSACSKMLKEILKA